MSSGRSLLLALLLAIGSAAASLPGLDRLPPIHEDAVPGDVRIAAATSLLFHAGWGRIPWQVRIALVVPGGVDRSGSERVIPALLWLIERLSARHEVTVVALAQEPEPGEWELLGARVVNLGRPFTRLPGARALLEASALRRALERHGPFDVVHAFWASPCGALAAAATRRRVPLVVSLAGGELVGLRDVDYGAQHRPRERAKVRLALASAAAVTAASAPMVEAAARLGVAARRIPLGVPREAFAPPLPRAPGDPLRLVHVGSLNRVKDPSTLLGAVAAARRTSPPFVLDQAGDDTLSGEAQREAERLGVAGLVRFHGWLGTGAVRDLLRGADLFVLSSRHEAGPVALLEAWACGVPAAGTRVGHLAEGDPERSLAVEPGDAAALGAAISSLLGDPRRRHRMGEAGRGWALAHDADATAALFEALYAELVPGAQRFRRSTA